MKILKKVGFLSLFPILLLVALIIASIASFQESKVFVLKKKAEEEQHADVSTALSGIPSFITDEMIIGALNTQAQYGYPASVCIAQVIGESGFGRYGPGGESGQGLSQLAYEYKNLFGIKGTGPAGSVNMVTGEQTSNGDDFTITAGFRVYHNYTECINDRAVLLTDVYSDLIAGVTDAKEFAQQMGSRWATDIRYAEKLINHMDNFNLYRLDTMTVEDYEEYQNSHSDPGEATEIQLRICEIAKNNQGTIPCTPDMCAAWVSGVYQAAGLPYPTGNAIDFWNKWKSSGSTSKDNIPLGAVVCGSGSGYMGSIYGHVGIYIGNGKVANNIGTFSVETLDQWCSWQTATCQGHTGWIGWVWPNNQPLNQ